MNRTYYISSHSTHSPPVKSNPLPMTVLSIKLTICVSTKELVGGGVIELFEVRRENVVVSEDKVLDIGVLGLGEVETIALEADLLTDFFEEVEGTGDLDSEDREDEEGGTSNELDDADDLFSDSFVKGDLADGDDDATAASLAEESLERRASFSENLRRLLVMDSFFLGTASLLPRLLQCAESARGAVATTTPHSAVSLAATASLAAVPAAISRGASEDADILDWSAVEAGAIQGSEVPSSSSAMVSGETVSAVASEIT